MRRLCAFFLRCAFEPMLAFLGRKINHTEFSARQAPPCLRSNPLQPRNAGCDEADSAGVDMPSKMSPHTVENDAASPLCVPTTRPAGSSCTTVANGKMYSNVANTRPRKNILALQPVKNARRERARHRRALACVVQGVKKPTHVLPNATHCDRDGKRSRLGILTQIQNRNAARISTKTTCAGGSPPLIEGLF